MSDQTTTYKKWKEYASEYFFQRTWKDGDVRNVYITRHTNHGDWIEEGGWMVCIALSSMNPWYLGEGGRWRYKYGYRYKTADEAYDALNKSLSLNVSYELECNEAAEKRRKKK